MALRNPRDMTEVAADTEAMFKPSSEIMVLVPAIIQTDHMIRANISIDAGTLSTIDAGAKRRGLTRSAFLASASLATIEREGR